MNRPVLYVPRTKDPAIEKKMGNWNICSASYVVDELGALSNEENRLVSDGFWLKHFCVVGVM